MRPTTYLVDFLAAASAAFAVPDFSGLPREIQDCIIGNHKLDVTWKGSYHWEKLSDEQFCKIDTVYPRTPTATWWVAGVFSCVCRRNRLSWVDNRMMKGKWATWMDEKCGGHDIGVNRLTGKMCKKQP
ncbi:hypothetical protein D6D28_01201 [Aureobasidium pullulans]|uniref:Uncharacterized protein n=1 Tax=Aureobasidium pullulans TaxID=5580 RepID=A0A4S8SYJ3_AURPU|nr:hypothetical protein D6D28_01201 [Aureobasidium pullulans]